MLKLRPKRILVGVDFEDVSRHAWRAAWRAASRFGAALDAVYCEPLDPETAAYGGAFYDKEKRREELARLRRRFRAGALHIVSGDPVSRLRRLARDRKYDLLVLGTHGRRGLRRLLRGSIAEGAAAGSACPVMIVPRRAREIRRVLVAADDEPDSRRAVFAAAMVSRAFQARLSILYVNADPLFGLTPAKFMRRRLRELPPALRRAVRPALLARQSASVGGILRDCRGHDLLVVAARGERERSGRAQRTRVVDLIRRTRIPMLVVPANSRRAPKKPRS